ASAWKTRKHLSRLSIGNTKPLFTRVFSSPFSARLLPRPLAPAPGLGLHVQRRPPGERPALEPPGRTAPPGALPSRGQAGLRPRRLLAPGDGPQTTVCWGSRSERLFQTLWQRLYASNARGAAHGQQQDARGAGMTQNSLPYLPAGRGGLQAEDQTKDAWSPRVGAIGDGSATHQA